MLATLLNGATTIGPGFAVQYAVNASTQAVYTGPSGSAQVLIEVSQDGVNFVPLTTLNISSSFNSTGITSGPWAYIRANLTSITAGASVSVYTMA